ncbi:MAG: thiamine pyrophosphate-dependent enzyme [Moorellales bacterium]
MLAVPEGERLFSGHSACPGCGLFLAVRYVLKALPPETVLIVPPSCIAGTDGPFPRSCLGFPTVHCTFTSPASSASGLSRALRVRGYEKAQVVVFAGDGATYDIGLQALSAAIERGEDFLYVCYNNQGYMNTGVQKSGATPWGAHTTTTPQGKPTPMKDLMEIVRSHRIPYCATAAPAFPEDLIAKVHKALSFRGVKYIEILVPCVQGWGIPENATVKVSRLSVETGAFPLYEAEDGGDPRLTYFPRRRPPISEYLDVQGRFRHLGAETVEALQAETDRRWEKLLRTSADGV